MDDNRKTKEQLIQELEDLRWRIAEFEKSETERKHAEEALRRERNTTEPCLTIPWTVSAWRMRKQESSLIATRP